MFMKFDVNEKLRRAVAYVLEEIFCVPAKPDIRFLARAAVIAALYAALTLLLAAISFGPVQFRVSEALTLLPILTPAAVPGLTIGCLVANLLGSATPWDMVFGPLATLVAAVLTRRFRERPLVAAAPPVLVNAVVVGLVIALTGGLPVWQGTLLVGAGQLGVCYVLGLPLYYTLRRLPHNIW
jgi:uncharacterized membrane protein